MIERKLYWKPQLDSVFDWKADYSSVVKATSVDLRSICPPIYDQGQLGSCTGNAIAGTFEIAKIKQGIPYWVPSRLFIYYNERVMEHTVNTDSGAVIKDGIQTLVHQGVCPETEWPYIESKFKTKPKAKCYTDALKNEVKSYSLLPQTSAQLQGILTAGYPYVFGFTAYTSFMSNAVAANGMMPMPQPGDRVEGGHAVVCVGYIQINGANYYIIRNSWGTGWGVKGYFFMPEAYMLSKLCSDFWDIKY